MQTRISKCVLLAPDLQPVGVEQQVSVVKQGHLRPLHQQEEDELDEQHERQLPDAADVEEHGAGQQGQQHAVAEVLQQGQHSYRDYCCGNADSPLITHLCSGLRYLVKRSPHTFYFNHLHQYI